MHDHHLDFPGDRGVQRKVRSGFGQHPRIAESEAIKSAMKLAVEPPVMVGLDFCSAAVNDVFYVSFFFTAMSSPH